MSRTYRYKHDAYIWQCFFSKAPYDAIDLVTGIPFQAGEKPLVGKAKASSWARWRADGGYRQLRSAKTLRKIKEGAYRTNSRKELHEFMRSEDYEVLIGKKPCFGPDYWFLV